MPKSATSILLSAEEQAALQAWRRAGAGERQLVERAEMILRAADGQGTGEIAAALGTRPARVSKWRTRFEQQGLLGLMDVPRAGAPRRYDVATERRVLAHLDQPPPEGHATWTGSSLAAALGDVSADQVWRVLRRHEISLRRRRSWGTRTDPEFSRKAVDVVGLYLHPPVHALVLAVDEKPRNQAPERAQGWLRFPSDVAVTSFAKGMRRKRSWTLQTALEVATGLITADRHGRRDFLDFMRPLLDGPDGGEVHVILHRLPASTPREARWLRQHLNVHFHDVQTYELWLNQIEIWFSILSGLSPAGASLACPRTLRDAIDAFVTVYDPDVTPFGWTKARQ